MSEPQLPLGGAVFDGLVEIKETGPQGMITLRGDLTSAAMAEALRVQAGVEIPSQRRVSVSGDNRLLWMSPDELLLLVPYRQAAGLADRLAQAMAAEHALVLDVSDARAMFTLRGTQVRDVLAKLAPVDFAPDALPEGEIRRTRFAQVAAGVWLTDATTAQVFCFRSVAEYMFKLLSAASDVDSAVGFHAR